MSNSAAHVGAEQSSLPKAEKRRREILAAALRVIAEGGVDAVTHRRVAAAAAVSLGSTTYYFATRDALIVEAFRFHIATQSEEISVLEAGIETPDLNSYIEAMVAWTDAELADETNLRAEYELILYAARDEELARAFWTWQRNLELLAADRLERLGLPDAFEAARLVMGLIRSYELERLARRPVNSDDLLRRLSHALRGSRGTQES